MKKVVFEKLDPSQIKFPGTTSESRTVEMVCSNKNGTSGCKKTFKGKFSMESGIPENERFSSTCPHCGHYLLTYFSTFGAAFKMGTANFHSTKQGQKVKRERTKKSERLGKTQWENVQPLGIVEGATPRNYTPGGPLDPNSKFNKGKGKKPKIFLP